MKSLAELKAIRDRMQGEVNMREDDNSHHIRVVVGMATCGIASGARPVLNKLAEDVQAKHLDNVIVTHITADGSEKISLDVSVEPDNEKGGAVNNITTPSTYTRSWTTDVSEGLISVNGTLTDNQMKFTSQT